MNWRRLITIVIAAGAIAAIGAGTSNAYDWSQALAFDVSAQPKIDRTWNWSLDEHAAPVSTTLYVGQTGSLAFVDTAAAAGSVDTRWLVGGLVNINPDPIVLMTSIDGMLYTGPAADYSLTPFAVTDCPGGFPQLVVQQVVCSYQVQAPQANTGFVGVTAHGCIDGDCSYDSKSSSAPFDFANATITEHQQCVTANESVVGALGTTCASAGPATFTAVRTIGPYSSCGNYTVLSTSSLTSAGTVVGTASGSGSVHVATRFAQWWLANVTNSTYSDLIVFLKRQIAAAQASLTAADPPAIATALQTIQAYLTRYSTWSSVPSYLQQLLLSTKATIDAYAARCA